MKSLGSGRIVANNNTELDNWRAAVGYHALKAGAELIEGPVELIVHVYLQRPKGHYRTGKNAHLLRDAAPLWPITKPDADKLLRSTLDALDAAGVFRDDSQVVDVHATKHYADGIQPGARITVTSMEDA